MALETGLDPPPLHGKCHLKFPFWFFEPFPYCICLGGSACKGWTEIAGELTCKCKAACPYRCLYCLKVRNCNRYRTGHPFQVWKTCKARNRLSCATTVCLRSFRAGLDSKFKRSQVLQRLLVSASATVCRVEQVSAWLEGEGGGVVGFEKTRKS